MARELEAAQGHLARGLLIGVGEIRLRIAHQVTARRNLLHVVGKRLLQRLQQRLCSRFLRQHRRDDGGSSDGSGSNDQPARQSGGLQRRAHLSGIARVPWRAQQDRD